MTGCAPGAAPQATTQDPDSTHAAAAAEHAMSGMSMPTVVEDLHMKLTPERRAAPGDSTRAAALVTRVRGTLAKYRDVRVAEADGFHLFLPGVKHQPVYHYTNRLYALEAMVRFDPDHPTSLLYQRRPGDSLVLVGAMYTAPARLPDDDLDQRIPLSIARWHEHVNWCIPPRGGIQQWRDSTGGRPVFGPQSPIATAEACTAVGGRFLPRIFGWMVHVNAFASDDPRVIWAAHHHEGMEEMHH
ncbi:MAG TPA: hypothetical protein VEO93_00860 [Gemmatimonadales bacterium]|nr:hypothetical protein [Gemmatimonadales bacterium]